MSNITLPYVEEAASSSNPSYTELQAAALARENRLQAQLQDPSQSAGSRMDSSHIAPKCYFLQKIPLEIRNMIYEILLTNDKLAQLSSIQTCPEGWNIPELDIQYHLSPSILQTCTEIYNEASVVFYQHNTFFLYCPNTGQVVYSPLNRALAPFHPSWGPSSYSHAVNSKAFTTSKAFSKIKQWKVFVELDHNNSESPSLVVFEFCKAVCKLSLRSLSMVLVWGDNKTSSWSPEREILMEYRQLSSFLYPLTMLRKIPNFELLEEARGSSSGSTLMGHVNLGGDFAMVKFGLETITQGDSPVIRVFEMYEKLVEYAQTFERNDTYKLEMRSEFGEERLRIIAAMFGSDYAGRDRLDSIRVETVNLDIKKTLSRDNSRSGQRDSFASFRSPFKTRVYHPVEDALAQASIALEMNNYEIFKYTRRQVIEYLEPQYKRIMLATCAIAEMAKESKRWGEFLSTSSKAYYHNNRTRIAEIMVLVDEYANSFTRDMPPSTLASIRTKQREFELAYAFHSREGLLLKIKHPTEQVANSNAQSSLLELSQVVQDVIDNMDDQMLQIREARKTLFEFDPAGEDPGCDIELEEWRCDEKIRWDLSEPYIRCDNNRDEGHWRTNMF